MKGILPFLLLILLSFSMLSGISFSAQTQMFSLFNSCSGQSSILVPAVMGNEGGLVKLSVRLVPGNGSAFLTTNPRTGVSTQESVDNAISYLLSEYNLPSRNCDILVSIDSSDAPGFVDGPSAGAAITAAIYSAASGKPLRQDAIVSGEVDSYGNVLPVGGLYEKAMAAWAGGRKYFVTPLNSISDRMMLISLRQE
ncbi:MAG: S16 family serine protease, partial [Candidatus Micrarchaeia archaeon]